VAPEITTVYADEGRFKQVLYNLLSNAVKFTPAGGRVDTVARLTYDAIEVTVADTGIGIAPEDQARIFEAFQQLDSSAARRHQGTGLGLALTRRLVELQGGRIWVESTPAEGSRFAFTVPLRVAAEHDDTETRELLPDLEGVVLAGLDAPWLTAATSGASVSRDSRVQAGERPAAAAEAMAAPVPGAALDAGAVRSA
jgi:histidine kinase/DNA gyrase B/HSP90-like ATPase